MYHCHNNLDKYTLIKSIDQFFSKRQLVNKNLKKTKHNKNAKQNPQYHHPVFEGFSVDPYISNDWKDSNIETSRSMSMNIALFADSFSGQFCNAKLHGATRTQAHEVLKEISCVRTCFGPGVGWACTSVFCVSDTD